MHFRFKPHDPRHQELAKVVEQYQKDKRADKTKTPGKVTKSRLKLFLYLSLLSNIALLTTVLRYYFFK